MRWRSLVFLGCVGSLLGAGCAGTRDKAHELTRVPTQWEKIGDHIAELEVSSLVRLRYGCAGCTRFVANELIVQPSGDYRVYDVTHRTETSQGRASAAAMTELREALASETWRDLAEGARAGTEGPPWLEIRSNGRHVTRPTPIVPGVEPALDRTLAALEAVMAAD